jgi:hypothetical protein
MPVRKVKVPKGVQLPARIEGAWVDADGTAYPDKDERGPDGERFVNYAGVAAQRNAARRQAETERQRAETERQRAEAERQRAERLAARLRALGISPDEV